MDDTRHSIIITIPFILVLFTLFSGCAAPNGDQTWTFLIRTDRVDVVQLAGSLTKAVSAQLEDSRMLGNGYPILSNIEFEPHPTIPGAQNMSCPSSQPEPSITSDCIRLNEHGDFVRTQPITWNSAAHYMYRVYVVPERPFARVDPTKDFVALDVFLLEDETLWEAVDQAIRDAAEHTGARPFQP